MELYTTSDRIEKAYQLFVSGRVAPVRESLWKCVSGSGMDCYTVTVSACTCPDFQKRRRICKHMLAAHAIRLVLAMRELRRATDLLELRRLAEKYAPAIKAAGNRYRQVAVDEYKAIKTKLEEHDPNHRAAGNQRIVLAEKAVSTETTTALSSPLCTPNKMKRKKEHKQQKERQESEQNQTARQQEEENPQRARRNQSGREKERGIGYTSFGQEACKYNKGKDMEHWRFFVNDRFWGHIG